MRSFEKSFELARKCVADPAMPMREVALMWKTTEQPLEIKLQALKDTAPGDLRIFEFADTESFQRQVRGLLTQWLQCLLAERHRPGNPGPF